MFDILKSEFIFLVVYCICAVILTTLFTYCTCPIDSNYLRDFHKSDYDNCSESDKSDEHMEYNKDNWPYKSNKLVPYDLDGRMKFFESVSRQIEQVDPKYPFIVRIDGCSFSGFSNKLKKMAGQKVFVPEFYQAMLSTACDLLIKFKPSTVYTHSDEITLVFEDCFRYDDDGNFIGMSQHYRNGKVYKLISEIPSYASTSFTRNILNKTSSSTELHSALSEYLKHNDLAFDGRIIVFPFEAKYEVANHMIWRTQDCYRNYVSAFSHEYLGKHKVNGVSTENRIEMLKEKGIDLDNEESILTSELGMKYGTFLKKFNSERGIHTIQAFYSKKLRFSEELVNFLLCPMDELKYETDEMPDLLDLDETKNSETTPDSVVIKTGGIKSSFVLDSYEFEDVFSGTFQLVKSNK